MKNIYATYYYISQLSFKTSSDLKYNLSSLLFYFQKHLFAAGRKYRLRSSQYQPGLWEGVPAHGRGVGREVIIKIPSKQNRPVTL